MSMSRSPLSPTTFLRSKAIAVSIDHFVYRIGLNAGMLAAALGGLDAFVFTAGIGENSSYFRRFN
jgi:acetate kinase